MTYVSDDARTLANYQMGVLDNTKLGLGFHEKQGVFARAAVFTLRALEMPVAGLRLFTSKDLADANLFKWTDVARTGLDRHVVRKRNAAAKQLVR